MGIKHVFVSGKSDSADTSLVRPSNWNADHTIDGNVDPDSDNAYSLGSSGTAWSDLFLGDGGVIDWGAGGYTITHTASDDSLDFSSDFILGTTGTPETIDGTNSNVSLLDFVLYSSSAGAFGRSFHLYQNSASPAANDRVSFFGMYGNDSGGNATAYASIQGYIVQTTDTDEDGRLDLVAASAGSTITAGLDGGTTAFRPSTNDAIALGTDVLSWSNLYLADGAIISWDADTSFINAESASHSLRISADSSNTHANTEVSIQVDSDDGVGYNGSAFYPKANDTAALGTSSLGWSDLHLADGGVVNWGNGGVTQTHVAASDSLTIALDAAAGLASSTFAVNVDNSTYRFILGPDDNNALGGYNDNIFFDFGAVDYPTLALVSNSSASYGVNIQTYCETTIAATGYAYIAQQYVKDSAAATVAVGGHGCYVEDNTAGSVDTQYYMNWRTAGTTSNMYGGQSSTVDGAECILFENGGSTTPFGLEIKNTNAGVYGSTIDFTHDSASPADNDVTGLMQFQANDSASNMTQFSYIFHRISDVTNTTEDTRFEFYTTGDGSGSAVTATIGKKTDAYWGVVESDFFFDDSGQYPAFQIRGERTSSNAAPYILVSSQNNGSGQYVCGFYHIGDDSASNEQFYTGIDFYQSDWTSGSEDSEYYIISTVAGTSRIWQSITGSFYYSGATGGNKGLGTINATAVYDDNVLLTCYPLEAMETGTVDVAKWDLSTRSVDHIDGIDDTRKHWGARRFAERIGTAHDPLTLAGQRQHVADKKHLTPYMNPEKYTQDDRPSVGEVVSSGIEMDELLFGYICQLEDRIAVLEGA